MSLSKRLLKHPAMTTAISYVLAAYIWGVYYLNHRRLLVADAAQPFVSGKENGIFAFWHGRMMILPPFYVRTTRTPKMHVLISLHRDGKLISQTIGHFGQPTITGSSSRGGEAAMREMIATLKDGRNVGITPDGPRGPCQQVVTEGAVSLARITGKPIVPVTFSASRYRRFNSWDRFMLALPFGRIGVFVGEPIYCDENTSKPAQRQLLEQRMNEQVAQADEAFA